MAIFKTEQQSRRLNRYTTLPVLLDLLRRKKIVLLDPSNWEDRNDAEIILTYKERKKIPKMFAICFGINDETIQHWKAYADGVSGCCIEFDEMKLLASFKLLNGFRWGDVKYKLIKEVRIESIELDQIPFVKRKPYECENEFRIIWEGETNKKMIEVDIDLRSINKITLNQKMPNDVSISIRDLLRESIGDPSRKITRSTLYENKKWIDAFKYESVGHFK